MIKKRYLITGFVEAGDHIRLILYPDEPIQQKKMSLLDMARINPEELQKQAIIQGIMSNNPPILYITVKEFEESNLKLHDHVLLSFEVE
jgi:hypothetical protein